MRSTLLIAAACLISGPVYAQEASQSALCQLLPEHRPAAAAPADGVEYKAGIDVHGNPVIAADLGAALIPVAQPVIIPVEIDLVQRFNLMLPNGVELKPTVATMKIHPDGRVEYNDRDVSDQAYYLCGKGEEPAPETAAEVAPQSQPETAQQGDIIEGQYP